MDIGTFLLILRDMEQQRVLRPMELFSREVMPALV